MNDTITSVLEKLDLSKREREFLKTAFTLHKPTINDIIRKSGLKRPTAYKIMESLVEKRLVQRQGAQRGARILPSAPEKLLEFAKKKTRLAKKAEVEIELKIEELKKLAFGASIMPDVKVVYGTDGYIEILEQTLEEPNIEIKYIGNIDELHKVIGREYDIRRYIPERVRENIRAKALLARTPTGYEFVKTGPQQRRETKLLPEGYEPKSFITLWKDRTLIFSGSTEAIALYIESPLISELYHELFDLLWERLE